MLSVSLEASDVLARLKNAPRELADGMDRAVEASATDAQTAARAQAPKDTHTLERSVRIRKPAPMVRDVFTNLVYAPRQNYGFVGTDALGRTYNQAGFYFMEAGQAVAEKRLPEYARAEIRTITRGPAGSPSRGGR